ncbi:MAG: polymorphic toxin-type HINT domain-containing protein [Cyclobacteriaceae bacterium]
MKKHFFKLLLSLSWLIGTALPNSSEAATSASFESFIITGDTTAYEARELHDELSDSSLSVIALEYPLVSDPDDDKNYIREYTPKVPLSDPSLINMFIPKEEAAISTTYQTAFGRNEQTVMKQASPDGNDMIIPIEYDLIGRKTKNYLPYVSSLSNAADNKNGRFKANVFTHHDAFYDNHFGDNSGLYAFKEIELERSPLGRVLKEGAPGEEWSVDEGNTKEFRYRINAVSDQVKNLKASDDFINIRSSYEANTLRVEEVWDENVGETRGHTITFTDGFDRVILKKTKSGSGTYLSNYYIYDANNFLRFIVPPEAIVKIESAGNNWDLLNDQSFRDKWLFQYSYDYKHRMVAHKVPGAGWIYTVYDSRDRPVLTQDGNQRRVDVQVVVGDLRVEEYTGSSYQISEGNNVTVIDGFHFVASPGESFLVSQDAISTSKKQWGFTKYDALNRIAYTGFYHSDLSREQLQNFIDSQAETNNNTYESFEDGGSFHGYSNRTFPTEINQEDILTVDYYDSYQFLSGSIDNPPTEYLHHPSGYKTGSKVRILGETELQEAVIFYDYRYKVIKQISQNHIHGIETTENEYLNDVSELITESSITHTSDLNDIDLKTVETYQYDHSDRLLTVDHQISDDGYLYPKKRIATLDYNILGELSRKSLLALGGGNFAQQVDFQYNIRGWLTKVNNGTTFDHSRDRFGMELAYDLNGNLKSQSWRSTGGAVGMNQNVQTFNYSYDALSRLLAADYESAGLDDDFSVRSIAYDANGNIRQLVRNQDGIDVDALGYYYDGNQLLVVEDVTDDPEGFDDGNTTGDDYSYDANGNLTKDLNKGISRITYNYLNLPKKITYKNGDYINYSYNAVGMKLQEESRFGENLTVKDYVNGKHYVNGELIFFSFSDGRVTKDGSDYHYEFNITDHLGNVRVTVDEAGEVIQRDDYYPFGLTFNSWHISPRNEYTFNGKEKLSWGVYDYQGRLYDPAIGRFIHVDPLASERYYLSPYNYVQNNPLIRIDPDGYKDITIYGDNGSSITISSDLLDEDYEFDISGLGVDFGGNYKLDGDDILIAALDIIGIVDPTGVADGLNAVIQFKKGDWLGAATSTAGLLPWVGDLPKAFKLKKLKGVINKAIDAVRNSKLGGKLPCGCFLAKTLIKTARGVKYINEIEEGDIVWAYDDQSGDLAQKKVINTFTKVRDHIYRIYFDGNLIEATNDHPFFIGGKWLKVEELKKGDYLTLYDQSTIQIDSIVYEKGIFEVFNFEVADYHTYFVSGENVLVHNSGPCPVERLRHYTSNKGIKGIEKDKVIKAYDQNKVFADKAKGKPLSAADASKKFGINKKDARNYVEFDVDASRVSTVKNGITGATEKVVKGDVQLNPETTNFVRRR